MRARLGSFLQVGLSCARAPVFASRRKKMWTTQCRSSPQAAQAYSKPLLMAHTAVLMARVSHVTKSKVHGAGHGPTSSERNCTAAWPRA